MNQREMDPWKIVFLNSANIFRKNEIVPILKCESDNHLFRNCKLKELKRAAFVKKKISF